MIIEKKTWPKPFQAIQNGKKNYELRLADWECNEGDTLVLKEWDPETKKYTGSEITKKVTYVSKFDINKLYWTKDEIEKFGLQVISIK